MRRFHSYGPVDPSENFCVERRELVERCVTELVSDPNKAGHFFTIWAPRQTGKTWLMRRAIEEIRARYGERFAVGSLQMQGPVKEGDSEGALFEALPRLFQIGLAREIDAPRSFNDWMRLFARKGGAFDRPVILLIDEFDSLSPPVLDALVSSFRAMYLDREGYFLHGLALVGVRAVLGFDSPRGSPFNVQRSLHVPNLTRDEVTELFAQYQAESGQTVEPEVAGQVFDVTRGQPGLVSWFGELLTEKYNPGLGAPITPAVWRRVYAAARDVEINNTILNLVKKARGPHEAHVVKLFTDPNVPFSVRHEWCLYLYTHGVIDMAPAPETDGARAAFVCRFSSPYVQHCLYDSLTEAMFGDDGPLLAIEPGDDLDDVFTPEGLMVPPLLAHYKKYLKRLAARGIDPWKGQPRRQDQQLTEAVGHFHLYAWLRNAVGRRCTISPEFPTGNGKVDLVLRWHEHSAVIEVKSFIDPYELRQGHAQAAAYARKLGLATATLAVFVPALDEAVLAKLSGVLDVDGVRVVVVAIGWA